MKLVNFIVVVLVLSLFVSSLSYAEQKYKRGRYVCSDRAEDRFKQNSEDLHNRYLYFSCEVIKGNDSVGLPELYILADRHSNLLANNFLAHYLQTNGELDNSFIDITTVDEAIKYRMRTQALIKLIPNYPPEGLRFIERDGQIELDSAYKLPHLYFLKYNLGIIGDYRVVLINSPNYEGDKNLETYPDYNTKMYDSLENVIKYAGECANLPQKAHFNPDRYQATIKACDLMRDVAKNIDLLEENRKNILKTCDNFTEDEESCPEYYKAHDEINELMVDYVAKYDELLGEFL